MTVTEANRAFLEALNDRIQFEPNWRIETRANARDRGQIGEHTLVFDVVNVVEGTPDRRVTIVVMTGMPLITPGRSYGDSGRISFREPEAPAFVMDMKGGRLFGVDEVDNPVGEIAVYLKG